MSETKPEIPTAMLDAATEAILRAQECGTGEDEPVYTRENFKRLFLYPTWQSAERYAKAALESADVAEMAAQRDADTALIENLNQLIKAAEARIEKLEAENVRLKTRCQRMTTELGWLSTY